jgi:hypothetical protein
MVCRKSNGKAPVPGRIKSGKRLGNLSNFYSLKLQYTESGALLNKVTRAHCNNLS